MEYDAEGNEIAEPTPAAGVEPQPEVEPEPVVDTRDADLVKAREEIEHSNIIIQILSNDRTQLLNDSVMKQAQIELLTRKLKAATDAAHSA
jgi:hypothetical protein